MTDPHLADGLVQWAWGHVCWGGTWLLPWKQRRAAGGSAIFQPWPGWRECVSRLAHLPSSPRCCTKAPAGDPTCNVHVWVSWVVEMWEFHPRGFQVPARSTWWGSHPRPPARGTQPWRPSSAVPWPPCCWPCSSSASSTVSGSSWRRSQAVSPERLLCLAILPKGVDHHHCPLSVQRGPERSIWQRPRRQRTCAPRGGAEGAAEGRHHFTGAWGGRAALALHRNTVPSKFWQHKGPHLELSWLIVSFLCLFVRSIFKCEPQLSFPPTLQKLGGSGRAVMFPGFPWGTCLADRVLGLRRVPEGTGPAVQRLWAVLFRQTPARRPCTPCLLSVPAGLGPGLR